MAKRSKNGRNFRKPSRKEPERVHRFLPQSVTAFMEGAARLDPRLSLPERCPDKEVLRLLHEYEEALGVKIDLIHPRLFRVRQPRKTLLPDGRRENVQLKWHGTHPQNGLSILKDGFRKGWRGMFGAGIYVGNRGKAVHYSGFRKASKGFPGRREITIDNRVYPAIPPTPPTPAQPGMLIQVEVCLGRVFKAEAPMPDLKRPPDGFHSVMGVAGVTTSWGGTLQFDEWVVYDPCQVSVQEIHLLG